MTPDERNYWLWVTDEKYYLDEDGEERRGLEPGTGWEHGAWWTCHKDTSEGDLILLYRKRDKKKRFGDIAYLIGARSDPYSLLGDRDAREEKWKYGCDYEPVEKFRHPLSIDEMRKDKALRDWKALTGNFQGTSFAVPPDTWSHLLRVLGMSETSVTRRARLARQRYRTSESEIEDLLAKNLRVFARYRLKLRERQYTFDRGGRCDLLCFDNKDERYVVIEIKRGIVGRDCIAQGLSYRASVAEEFPSRRKPLCLVVGTRLDTEAEGMLKDIERLEFLPLEALLA